MAKEKKLFFTIDDSPSVDFSDKMDFLYEYNIPAIVFYVGEQMEQYPKQIIDAIQKGFIKGNYSYSHPHFSTISFEEPNCEITRTDKIIDHLYARAGNHGRQMNLNFDTVF